VYAAAIPEGQTQRSLVSDLLSRAFSGSLDKFVLQAVAAKRATPEELAEVKNLLEEYERSLRCQS
jgi:predicted transcriptional regulator